jgi:O-antigen ligase
MSLLKRLKALCCFEAVFTLFLFAGPIKAYYPNLPVDLTAAFFLLSVLSAVFIWLRGGLRITKSFRILLYLWALLACWVALSMMWSISRKYALQKTCYFWSLTSLALIAGGMIIGPNPDRLRRFTLFLAAMSGLAAVFTYLMMHTIVGNVPNKTWLVGGVNRLLIGRTILVGLVVTLVYAFARKQKLLVRVGWLLGFFFLIGASLLSGSRGPFLGGVIVLLILGVLGLQKAYSGCHGKSYYVAVGLFLLIVTAGPFVVGKVIDIKFKTLERLAYGIAQGDLGFNASRRGLQYRQATELWSESLIIGHGIGSFAVRALGVDDQQYPHSIWYESMAELGLVGYGLLVAITFYAFSRLWHWRKLANDPLHLLLFCFFWALALQVNLTGDINDNRMFFMVLGLIVGYCARALPVHCRSSLQTAPPRASTP